ncbi:MAG: GcrA family cell cycle regulator [Micavibrio sp.]|nr:GcrA family cell cycle regulator [Micavibrio sp.]
MSWTDDRVAVLKKLWGEGKTAAEIAKELGNVTRNAVIGKAHRLKLSNRASPIQQNKAPAAKAAAPAPKAAPVVVEKKQPANTSVKPAPSLPKRTSSLPTNKKLIDLKANECRWSDGDPREDDFGFCGCKVVPGLPYCAEHAKIAYQAATRNRILKAEQFETPQVSAEEMEIARKAVNS